MLFDRKAYQYFDHMSAQVYNVISKEFVVECHHQDFGECVHIVTNKTHSFIKKLDWDRPVANT